MLHTLLVESEKQPILPCAFRFLGFRNRERHRRCLDELQAETRNFALHNKYSSMLADWRLYLGDNGRVRVTQSREDVYHLEKMWFPTPAAKKDAANSHNHDSDEECCNDKTCINYKPSFPPVRPYVHAHEKREDDPRIPKDPAVAVKMWDKAAGVTLGGLVFKQPSLERGSADAICVRCKDPLCLYCDFKIDSRKLTQGDLAYGKSSKHAKGGRSKR
ncbi:hypothetical protein MN608_10135 [Microdochium nivale]|nr:hypothetical protein MN608_10135 [Microdochium nivale]